MSCLLSRITLSVKLLTLFIFLFRLTLTLTFSQAPVVEFISGKSTNAVLPGAGVGASVLLCLS